MRKTLRDKLNDYIAYIEEKDNEFLRNSIITYPNNIYVVNNYSDAITKYTFIKAVYIRWPSYESMSSVRKVTKKYLQHLINSYHDCNVSNIYCNYYKDNDENDKVTLQLGIKNNFIRSYSLAIKLSSIIKKIKAYETDLINSGNYIYCANCHKLFEKAKAVEGKIINMRMYGSFGKTFLYDSYECYQHHQMGHEG